MRLLAWLLQGLLLLLCLGSSGSVVRAFCLSRYAHYIPPQPLVSQAHSLQRVWDYLGSSSITYLPMHCLGLKYWHICWKIVKESIKNWTVGRPGKFRNTKLVCTYCSPVYSPVQCPESSICTYPICNVATMSQPCKQADNMVVTKLSHLCCLGSCHLPVTTMLKTLLNLLTILIPGLWQLVITLLQLCNFNMNTASY